ncbi:MAG: tetratricopeptide repeat protein [bacterium]|nr:tetratricopeptide repeat protein [bacterium]
MKLKLTVLLMGFLILMVSAVEAKVLNDLVILINQGRLQDAEALCLKLKKKEKALGFRYLADAFLQQGKRDKAVAYYEKAQVAAKYSGLKKLDILVKMGELQKAEAYCLKMKKKKQPRAYCLLAEGFINADQLDKAALYYGKAQHPQGFTKIGDALYKKGQYKKAEAFYERSGKVSQGRAANYEALGFGIYKQDPLSNEAKQYYDKAIAGYEYILKNFDVKWKASYFPALKRCIGKRETFPKTEAEKARDVKLKKILIETSKYCEKLKNSAFHFFCNEDISESFNIEKDMGDIAGDYVRPGASKFVYEYQLLKEKGKMTETRVLKKKNGMKMNVSDAELETIGYRYEKLIFGPVALLSRFWCHSFHYRLLGEEMFNGDKAVIIEAIPTDSLKRNSLFGKVWVRETDYKVLKIQWCPRSLGNFEAIETTALRYGEIPDIVFLAEFGIEKRGLRFPSRYYIEEAYVNAKGKRFIRVKMESVLSNYMFFSVGTEVIDSRAKK